MCHISLEIFWQGLELFFRPHLNRKFTHNVMGLQSYKSPNFGNYSHLRVLRQNDIWVLVPWPCTKYIIMGKVVASPKFEPWWVLWVCVCSWFVCALKVLQLCYALTNLLFGLCKSVWIIDLLVIHPSPYPEALAHPSTPKVLQVRDCASTPSSSIVFTFRLIVEFIKESGGASFRLH